MPKSVLEAIKLGLWDFEPSEADPSQYEAADAMPGTKEKLEVMAERLRCGLPLWHEADREAIDAPPPRKKLK
ncbi:MAG TPA: hypothetical protein VIH42_14375 [Thermoguttaceae bacterium]